jgi:hypothetical protein
MNWGILAVFGVAMYAISPRLRGKDPMEQFFGGRGVSKGRWREAPDAAFIPLRYDHERLAEEMRAEGIAEPFVKTVETGWWTTCLEILPAKERAGGMY